MSSPEAGSLPHYDTIALGRDDRLLTITLNKPDSLNAVDLRMHEELADVFTFAAMDEHSDVVVLTGAGKAFSAGGNLEHIANNAAHPELFDNEVRLAKRIVAAADLSDERPRGGVGCHPGIAVRRRFRGGYGKDR